MSGKRKNNTRMKRPCKICDKMFEPTGKYTFVCNNCKTNVLDIRKIELIKKYPYYYNAMGENKTHLQCGYEQTCKPKYCLKCTRRTHHEFSLTLAEKIVIEDFAVCDLKAMIEENKLELELMQEICFKIMKKIYKDEGLKKKVTRKGKLKLDIKENV